MKYIKRYQQTTDFVGKDRKGRLTKSASRSVLGGKDGSTQTLSFPTDAVLTTELMRTAGQILALGLSNRSYKQTGKRKQ